MSKGLDRNPIVNRGIKALKESRRLLRHYYNTLTDLEPKIIILVYHRILPKTEFNPFRMVVTLPQFIKQIDAIAKKYPIVNLNDIICQQERGKTEHKACVVLTFDDGYCDNYEVVFPILAKKGLTATFFLTSSYIDSNKPAWDWQVMNILYHDHSISSVKIGEETIKQKNIESRVSFALRVFQKMKSLMPQIRQEVIDDLNNQVKIESMSNFIQDRCITWQEAIKMSQAGMEIGAHGLSHCSLAKIPFPEAQKEMMGSKEIIEQNIKKPCYHFAFPFGSINDYNQSLVNYAQEIGFKTCLLNVHGYNHFKKDITCFKRIIMEESTNLKYLLG